MKNILLTLIIFVSFNVLGIGTSECIYGRNGTLLKDDKHCPMFERDYVSPKSKTSSSINLICKLQITNSKKKSEIKDRYGRRIGSIEKQNNESYSLSVVIDNSKAKMKFDEKLLPQLNIGSSISGDVRTSDNEYRIYYEPNVGNRSTIIINRYSGFVEIKSKIFGGVGNTLLDLIEIYEGKSTKKKEIIGECNGSNEQKF